MNKAAKQQRELDARLSPPKLTIRDEDGMRASFHSLRQSSETIDGRYIRKQYVGAYSGSKTSFVEKRKSLQNKLPTQNQTFEQLEKPVQQPLFSEQRFEKLKYPVSGFPAPHPNLTV